MKSKLLTRTLTGIVFVVVMLGSVLLSKWSFIILFLIINLMGLHEYFKITQKGEKLTNIHYWGYFVAISGFVLITLTGLNILDSRFLLLIFPVLISLFIPVLTTDFSTGFKSLGQILSGLLMVSVPVGLLISMALHGNHYSPKLVMIILILVWVNDTFAYLAGILFGKHKLIPKLSPLKTWEGMFGGIFFTILVSVIIGYLLKDSNLIIWIIGGLIISASSVVGDMVESGFKRQYQVKDSGTLLPGHGGILDRFDGFLFMIPFFSAFYIILSHANPF